MIKKLIFNCFLTKPSTHYISPKFFNLVFKKSIDNKSILLNVRQFTEIEIILTETKAKNEVQNEVTFLKNEINVEYKIYLKVREVNQKEYRDIHLGTFNNKKDAIKAVNMLQETMFSTRKTFYKLLSFVVFFVFLIIVMFGGNPDNQTEHSNALMGLNQKELNTENSVIDFDWEKELKILKDSNQKESNVTELDRFIEKLK